MPTSIPLRVILSLQRCACAIREHAAAGDAGIVHGRPKSRSERGVPTVEGGWALFAKGMLLFVDTQGHAVCGVDGVL